VALHIYNTRQPGCACVCWCVSPLSLSTYLSVCAAPPFPPILSHLPFLHHPTHPNPQPSSSLGLKVYLFVALLSYPWCVMADVLTTPFLLAHLLLVHFCFSVRYGEPAPKPPQGRQQRRMNWRTLFSEDRRSIDRSGVAREGATPAFPAGQTAGVACVTTQATGGVSAADEGSSASAGGGGPGWRAGLQSSGGSGASGSSGGEASEIAFSRRSLFRIVEEQRSSFASSSLAASSVPPLASPLSLESGRRRMVSRSRKDGEGKEEGPSALTSPMSR
jgi:hypothetical protein